jgi:hypothetical protein
MFLRRIISVLCTSLIIAITFSYPATADDEVLQPGGISIRIAQISGAERDNPLARLYFVDHMQPLEVMTRRIEVSNTTSSVQSVSIYPGAASLIGGEFTAEPGRASNELTGWVRVNPDVVELLPGAYATINVTFSIPASVISGTRYGVIWAEVGTSGSIASVNRVGIRIMLPVGVVEQVEKAKVSRIDRVLDWIKKNYIQTLAFALLASVNLLVVGKRAFGHSLKTVRRKKQARKQRKAPTLN